MVTIGANDRKIAYGIKHLILDDNSDFGKINNNQIAVGSTAFVIETSKYYMLNSNKKWKEVQLYGKSSSSGSSGGSGDVSGGLDYDGGSIDGTDPYFLL